MSAVSRYPLAAGEAAPIAEWFRLTLGRAADMRTCQQHGDADYLERRCRDIFNSIRAHGFEHGYCADLLFADGASFLNQEQPT